MFCAGKIRRFKIRQTQDRNAKLDGWDSSFCESECVTVGFYVREPIVCRVWKFQFCQV